MKARRVAVWVVGTVGTGWSDLDTVWVVVLVLLLVLCISGLTPVFLGLLVLLLPESCKPVFLTAIPIFLFFLLLLVFAWNPMHKTASPYPTGHDDSMTLTRVSSVSSMIFAPSVLPVRSISSHT